MAFLTDPQRRAAYMDAVGNGHLHDYVQFRLSDSAIRWIKAELGITLAALRLQICDHIKTGGKIHEVKERRPEWSEHEYHYDLRFQIGGTDVYVETRLIARIPFVPNQPSILVVNIHAP